MQALYVSKYMDSVPIIVSPIRFVRQASLIIFVLIFGKGNQPLSAQNQLTLDVAYPSSIDLNPDVHGVNNWISTRPYYLSNGGFISKYNDLGKPLMRYPGGTASNYLNLAKGWHEAWPGANANDSNRVSSFNKGMTNAGKGTKGEEIGKFIDFLQATDATSTFVVNLTTMSGTDVATVLDSIKNRGEELDYVELANEVYFGQYTSIIADEASYIALAKDRADTVRSRFPNAKIGALLPSQIYTKENFLPGGGSSASRQEKWHQALKSETFYDALVIHMYSSIGMDHTVLAADFLPYQTAYNHTIAHADLKFDSTFAQLSKDFPSTDIWVSEFHVGGFSGDVRQYRLRHSYLGGLYSASFMLKLFSKPQIKIGNWHSMVQWLTYSESGGQLSETYNFGTKVNYHLFKLFAEPSNNSERFATVEVGNILNYTGIGQHSGSFADVEAGCFYNERTEKGYLILINKWENTYQISTTELESKLKGTLTSTTEFAPDKSLSLTAAIESEDNYSRSFISPNNGQYSILPFSVYVFEYIISGPLTRSGANNLKTYINLYPNPSQRLISIERNDQRFTEWKIHDTMGRLIDEGKLMGKETRLSTSKAAGVVLVSLYGKYVNPQRFKLIIQ